MWLVLGSAISLLAMIWLLDLVVLPKRTRGNRGGVFTFFSVTPPLVYYSSILMLTYRPIFSLLFSVGTYAVIVVLNNAKVKAVKEPLVYSDFHLFREVIRHPHLYVKYIDMRKLLGIVALAVLAVYASFRYEPPIIERAVMADYLPAGLFFTILLGAIYAIIYGPLQKPFRKILLGFGPTADVTQNVTQLGLVVCLIFYFFLSGMDKVPANRAGRSKTKQADGAKAEDFQTIFQNPERARGGRLPDIIAVQAESFFDVRYLQSGLDENILENYDSIVSTAAFHGRLTVPAWGAYTMRTEFAFLSGLPEDALGHHKFNPYLQLGSKPFWTLAHNLKALGYTTVCVHPFPATFFNRKNVFPNLGFDHFIDMNEFDSDAFYGPYVSDVALGQRIIQVVEDSEKPVFVFAITMENHGAWPVDRLKAVDGDSMKEENWPLGCFSLNHYIAHMRNSDQMMKEVSGYLKERDEPAVFCLYGDHMPNLQNAFSQVGYDDPRTDYFIWTTRGKRSKQLDTSADTLSRLLLDVALNERSDNLPKSQETEQVAATSRSA
ncbi:LTA synthase family protein [Sneathiella chinensis]|uniref:Capsular polysaccharide biosynthesis protein n=1 Tax=Sneathiella chinensis TaxID=349750 RepID=A0ABQ5U1P3_9PROT|nr:LTA synthase family protein [Sneathiella chinensis]GLQ05774.1 capsular polysaccharide biosynthesis protein [Sneathiella chinensis]